MIRKLQRDGQGVEFRADADIRAVLGVELLIDTTAKAERSLGVAAAALGHVIEVVGGH